MKTLSTGLFSLVFFFAAVPSRAQTADEIVNKYITAIGGKDAIKSVKTISEEGSLDVMGNTAPSTTIIADGKGFKSTVDFNGQQIVQVVTGNGGWMINPMMGQTTATAMPAEQLKASRYQMDIGGPLMDYASKGTKLELLGKDTANGSSVYKLKLTTKDSITMTLLMDVNTGYLVRMLTPIPGQDGEVTVNLSDYKKVDGGFTMPYAQQIVLPQITISMTTKKIEINKPVDPAIFDMPK